MKNKKKKISIVLWSTTLFVLSIVFLFFFSIPVYVLLRTADWDMLQADVTMHNKYEAGYHFGKQGNQVQYLHDYSYQYEYYNTKYSFAKSKQKYPPRFYSKKLTCYVNPSNPTEHVYKRSIGLLQYLWIAASVLCICGGISLVKKYPRNLKR